MQETKPKAHTTVALANPNRTRIVAREQAPLPSPDAPETTRAA